MKAKLPMQLKNTSGNIDKNRKIKRLFWDIETAPCVGLFFQAGWGLNINPDAILQERKIICIGYKWEHEKKVHVLRWDENQDDRQMIIDFIEIANEADELVAHYGNHFDTPWLRTRALYHKLPPIPIYKTVDTKALASKYFYFNSNKLDYISQFLGHGKKLHTEFELWKKILWEKCQKSLDYMCKYCGVDVLRLEAVYHDIMQYAPVRTHAGVMMGHDKWTCPRTGSKDVVKEKTRVTANGTVQHQMRNVKTGCYFQISNTAYEQYKKYRQEQNDKLSKIRQPAKTRKR